MAEPRLRGESGRQKESRESGITFTGRRRLRALHRLHVSKRLKSRHAWVHQVGLNPKSAFQVDIGIYPPQDAEKNLGQLVIPFFEYGTLALFRWDHDLTVRCVVILFGIPYSSSRLCPREANLRRRRTAA